jgi:hypothetical protein
LVIGAVLLAMSTAACSPATTAKSTPPALSDPNAILSGSFAALKSAMTVHVDGTLDGTVDASSLAAVMGGGKTSALSGTVKLDGTKLVGDIDMSKQAFDLTLAFPASLLGFKAEAILVDGYTYTMFDLVSSKFTRTKVSSSLLSAGGAPDGAPGASGSPGAGLDFQSIIGQLQSRLDSSGTAPAFVGQDTLDGKDAYHLRLTVPAGLLNQELEAALGAEAGGITLDVSAVDYWVYTDGLGPAKIQTKATSLTLGRIDLGLTLSQYNKPVTIQAPPAGQIEVG